MIFGRIWASNWPKSGNILKKVNNSCCIWIFYPKILLHVNFQFFVIILKKKSIFRSIFVVSGPYLGVKAYLHILRSLSSVCNFDPTSLSGPGGERIRGSKCSTVPEWGGGGGVAVTVTLIVKGSPRLHLKIT